MEVNGVDLTLLKKEVMNGYTASSATVICLIDLALHAQPPISKRTYENWTDAKHSAAEQSLIFGYAWMCGGQVEYRIAVGETAEEAPRAYILEFKDGIQQ